MLKAKNKKNNNFKQNTIAGFAVLFAILLASFLITLGISIFSISLKEIQITTSTRDSQIAYYVADSARECALYYDNHGTFPACIDNNCDIIRASKTPTITCNGNPIKLTFTNPFPYPKTYSTGPIPIEKFFQASSSAILAPVSDIRITKTYNQGIITTMIEAFGHNTGVIGRRVERGIRTITEAGSGPSPVLPQ